MSDISKREIIKEFGPDIVYGVPEGQIIKMRGTLFGDAIRIWEEFEGSGNQVLTIEDIIEELEKVPKKFHKIIDCVILNPYMSLDDPNWIASAGHDGTRGWITIYKTKRNRAELKEIIAQHEILLHEIGHIFDDYGSPAGQPISESTEWSEAECLDSQTWSLSETLKRSYVSFYDQISNNPAEDFAESFRLLYSPDNGDDFKKRFPNRSKFIEGLFR